MSYPNEEVNCTEPPLQLVIPTLMITVLLKECDYFFKFNVSSIIHQSFAETRSSTITKLPTHNPMVYFRTIGFFHE